MKKRKQAKISHQSNSTVNNGLASALNIGNEIQSPFTSYQTASPLLLSLNWVPLANMYKSNSFVKLAVDLPVEDAFRDGGFELDSNTLEADELEQLQDYMNNAQDIERLKDCIRWGRLYGGGLIFVNTNQKPDTPFNPATIYKKDVEFMALDRWQCVQNASNLRLADQFIIQDNNLEDMSFTVDKSRIFTYCGAPQPYYIQNLLQGWGASILEAVIPQLNEYVKANSVIFELLDEAKIDVVKIFGLAETLMSPAGESAIKKRLEIASTQKNYKSLLALDSQDEYEQKQLSFGSLDQILEKIFLLICSAIRLPYSKVFGKGANGLGTGAELDIENYNAMISSDIRVPSTPILKQMVKIRCYQLFGRNVDDIRIKWKPLRVLSEKEVLEVQTAKINNWLQLLGAGIMTKTQVAEQLNNEGIVLFSDEELNAIDDNDIDEDFDEVLTKSYI
jgi:hypothetical protein